MRPRTSFFKIVFVTQPLLVIGDVGCVHGLDLAAAIELHPEHIDFRLPQ
jgi:hypothetical protein